MPASKLTPERKSRSGSYLPDDLRKTKAVKLRLKPEVMQQLYSLSTEMSDKPGTALSYAEVVTAALAALEREMNAECAGNEEAWEEG